MDLVGPALLSGVVAGAVAIVVTRAIEKLGGLTGGVLASCPTTVVPASLGLASRLGGGEALTAALFALPFGMLVNAGFLLSWRYLPPRLPPSWPMAGRLAAMIVASLSIWFAGAAALVAGKARAGPRDVGDIVALGGACTGLLGAVGIAACFWPLDAPKGTKPVPLSALLARGVVACASISAAVLISKADEVAAGFATTFPAIFLTTMVSVWLSQGAAVSTGAVGPMVLGSASVPVYAMVFARAVGGGLDPYGAAALAWLVGVLGVSLPVTAFLRWRRAASAAAASAAAAGAAGATADDASAGRAGGLASQDATAAAAAADTQLDEEAAAAAAAVARVP